MALQLAKNVYACGFHCPTWALRADDPSRQKRVRPARVALPEWLLLLRTGKLEAAQDLSDDASGTPRSWGRWLLFGHAALLAVSGDYDTISSWSSSCSSTSKQAGSGTRPCDQDYSCSSRETVGRVCPLVGDGGCRAATFSPTGEKRPGRGCNPSRRIWPGSLETRRNYAETVNVVVQRHPFLKTFLAGPWRLLTTWESLCPSKVHPPFPLPLLRATVTTALAWGWRRCALLMLIGFYALLRPCELIALRVSDCLMTSETGLHNVVFLKLQLVKTRTRGARQQSVRLDVQFVIDFLKKSIKTMAPQEKLWPHSSSLFRRRMQQVLKTTCGMPDVCLPSSLRPGGATFWFREWNEDLIRLQWRGRWMPFKTLAHYIQELGCVNVLDALKPSAKVRVQYLVNRLAKKWRRRQM